MMNMPPPGANPTPVPGLQTNTLLNPNGLPPTAFSPGQSSSSFSAPSSDPGQMQPIWGYTPGNMISQAPTSGKPPAPYNGDPLGASNGDSILRALTKNAFTPPKDPLAI